MLLGALLRARGREVALSDGLVAGHSPGTWVRALQQITRIGIDKNVLKSTHWWLVTTLAFAVIPLLVVLKAGALLLAYAIALFG